MLKLVAKLHKIFNVNLNESSQQNPIYMSEWLVAFNAPTALFLRKISSAVESSEEGLSTALKEHFKLYVQGGRKACLQLSTAILQSRDSKLSVNFLLMYGGRKA